MACCGANQMDRCCVLASWSSHQNDDAAARGRCTESLCSTVHSASSVSSAPTQRTLRCVGRSYSAAFLAFDCFATAMLSTRLGYGRPAALARALAWVFCAADSGLDVLAGLDFFQGAVLLLAGFLAAVLLLVAFLAATFLVAPFRTLLCCVARLLVAFFAVPLRGVARFFAAVRAPLFDVAALAPVFAALFWRTTSCWRLSW